MCFWGHSGPFFACFACKEAFSGVVFGPTCARQCRMVPSGINLRTEGLGAKSPGRLSATALPDPGAFAGIDPAVDFLLPIEVRSFPGPRVRGTAGTLSVVFGRRERGRTPACDIAQTQFRLCQIMKSTSCNLATRRTRAMSSRLDVRRPYGLFPGEFPLGDTHSIPSTVFCRIERPVGGS